MSKSTREKILSVTAKIIATQGLEAASIRNVCEKAEVKAPTVYYYFKDKDGLIEAVVRMAYEKYTIVHNDYVKNPSPIKELIRSWDIFFEFVEKETDLFHAIVLVHLSQKIPEEGFQLFYSILEIFNKLEKKKKLKLSAAVSAQLFYAHAYGVALVYVSQGKSSTFKSNIEVSRKMCMRGLLA
jgi:AcrR family transcriptional regulator